MKVSVIGAANIDITATALGAYLPGDSNPSAVSVSYGGVGRNIAHDLSLLGHDVRFVTAFGGDAFSKELYSHCLKLGMDLSLARELPDVRSNLYLSINNAEGELMAGAADMPLVKAVDSTFLRPLLPRLNESDALAADTNLDTEALGLLLQECEKPLFIDAVSAPKAKKLAVCFRQAGEEGKQIRVHSLKLNTHEASSVADELGLTADLPSASKDAAAFFSPLFSRLHSAGVLRIYITQGEKGVCFSEKGLAAKQLPALPVKPVNVSGAGDAFTAALIHAFSLGLSAEGSACLGMKAASLTLTAPSAVCEELRNLL